MSDDELPAWMLTENDNINTSWACMDPSDIARGNYIDEICQINGTACRGEPGKLNGYYGIIIGYKKGYMVVNMPQVEGYVMVKSKHVLVQTTISQREALMLPSGRYLSKLNA